MHKIVPKVILLYYEYPQVFLAENAVGQSYCCMLASDEPEPKYLCSPISTFRRQKLLSNSLDLRELFRNPEIEEFFWSLPGIEEDGCMMLESAEFSACPEAFLPKAGLVFDSYDEVVSKAVELNATVSFASLSVPESDRQVRIRSVTLAQFLTFYQNAVRNLSKKISKSVRSKIPIGGAHFGIDVFGYSHGSFTVHFRSSNDGDLFGDNHIQALALEELSNFLMNTERPEVAFQYLQSIKGHAAASLIRLVEFVNEQQCPLKVTWATPRTAKSSVGETDAAGIRSLIELCKEREDISEEIVVLVGVVASASIDGNIWRMNNEEDGEQYRGVVSEDSDISMSGIVIEVQRYRFRCREKIEINPGTGRETVKLSLFEIEELERK